MKKFLIGGVVVGIVVLIALLILMGSINSIIKAGVEKVGPVVLQAPVTLSGVNISAFSGSGKMQGLMVGNPDGYDATNQAFKIKQLQIELDPKSVTSEKIHVKSIIIDGPQIVFEGGFRKNNLTQLQANAESFASSGNDKKEKASPQTESKKLVVDHIRIVNGSISVKMGLLQGQKLTVPLPTIELKNIGKGKDASIADVLSEIIAGINRSVVPAVQAGVGNFSQKLQKEGKALQGQVGGKVQKGLGKLQGLFGK